MKKIVKNLKYNLQFGAVASVGFFVLMMVNMPDHMDMTGFIHIIFTFFLAPIVFLISFFLSFILIPLFFMFKNIGIKRITIAVAAFFLLVLFTAVLLTISLTGEKSSIPSIVSSGAKIEKSTESKICNRPVLKIASLNIAHGRNQSFNQFFLDRREIEQNLKSVIKDLEKTDALIVSLQEADGPSFWSGNFNHIEFLAMNSDFKTFLRGEHVKGFGLSYGTAIISKCNLEDPLSVTFNASPPTFSKGFVIGSFTWKTDSTSRIVDIVSVHLDFSREYVRKRQIKTLIETLKNKNNQMIIMGDFNSEWNNGDSVIADLVESLNLNVYQPDETGLWTFRSSFKRLDWILISSGLQFLFYDTEYASSDHRIVFAEIAQKDQSVSE